MMRHPDYSTRLLIKLPITDELTAKLEELPKGRLLATLFYGNGRILHQWPEDYVPDLEEVKSVAGKEWNSPWRKK